LGKIPAEDYPAQRSALLAETAAILQRIDALREQQLVSSSPAHAVRQPTQPRRPTPVETSPDDEIEALIAKRRRERAEKAAGFCPQCGKPVQQSDRFCSKCGTPLLEEVEQAE
jgi:ribosomal protein L32